MIGEWLEPGHLRKIRRRRLVIEFISVELHLTGIQLIVRTLLAGQRIGANGIHRQLRRRIG